jgi:hypothetical protein
MIEMRHVMKETQNSPPSTNDKWKGSELKYVKKTQNGSDVMNEGDIRERLARIEERCQHLDDELTEQMAYTRDMHKQVTLINRELGRYRGFVGAILLVLTSVGAALKMGWEYFVK